MSAPLRAGDTPGLASELFWLSFTSLMTFGAPLLSLPDVLDRHRTSVPDLAPECRAAWSEVVNRSAPPAVGETRESVLRELQLAVTGELARRGRHPPVEIAGNVNDDTDSDDALRKLGVQLAAPVVVVADVSFAVALRAPDCIFVMRASATLHLEPTEVRTSRDPAHRVTLTRETIVPVRLLASDPAIEPKTRQNLLGELGKELVAVLSRSGSR